MRMLIMASLLAITAAPALAQYSSAEAQWYSWRSAHPDGGITIAGWESMDTGQDIDGSSTSVEYLRVWRLADLVGLKIFFHRNLHGVHDSMAVEISFDCRNSTVMTHRLGGEPAENAGVAEPIDPESYMGELFRRGCG